MPASDPHALQKLIGKNLKAARAAADAPTRSIESDWKLGEEVLARVDVIQPAGSSRSPLVGLCTFRSSPNGLVYSPPETRLCPTVLEHELRKSLENGARHFRVIYRGERRSSAGTLYHAFTVQPLDIG